VSFASFGRLVAVEWMPDGRQILYDALEAGNSDIYVVDAGGGVPRRVTTAESGEHLGSWSRDGRFIYFESDRSGTRQVWKIPSEGGEAVQMTRGGGTSSRESWDGRFLFFTRSKENAAIWKVSVEGGEETEVFPGPVRFDAEWEVIPEGLYFASEGPDEPYSIRFLDFDSGEVTEVLRRQRAGGGYSMTVSPDEEWVLFTEPAGAWTAELMLVENFR
jgi:dipeptidyl aminopeptidase/acylaminoacyl peptidase